MLVPMLKQNSLTISIIMLSTLSPIKIAYATQLPPPHLVRAASEEVTSAGTLYCNRSIIYWSNPSQSDVVRYRVYINGRDSND